MTAGAARKLRWPGSEVRLVTLCGLHSHICLLHNNKAQCCRLALTRHCGALCVCDERHHNSLAVYDVMKGITTVWQFVIKQIQGPGIVFITSLHVG